MRWFDILAGGGSAGTLMLWLPLAGLAVLVLSLSIAETCWPLHRDQRDASRVPGNFGLGIVNMAVAALLPVTAVAAGEWARLEGFGLLHWLAAPTVLAVMATLIVRSLLAYWLHRLAHSVPILWRMHRVHHCDTEVDLSTGVRHHPLEVVYLAMVGAAAAALIGLDPLALTAYELVAFGYALWTHANTSLSEPVDRRVTLLLVTPAVHHVHHSARREETDSNYGDVITFWDRLFGTFRMPPHEEVRGFRLGLGDAHDAGAANILFQLRAPFMRKG